MSIRTLSNAHLISEAYADNPRCDVNKADRIDHHGDRWVWCDTCGGFRSGTHHGRHKPGYGWPVAEIDEAYGPLTCASR